MQTHHAKMNITLLHQEGTHLLMNGLLRWFSSVPYASAHVLKLVDYHIKMCALIVSNRCSFLG